MTALLGQMFHWSPIEVRPSIRKRGLKPTCPTAVAGRPVPPDLGHFVTEDELDGLPGVCLGTSPAVAWSLSGVWSAARGSVWDLWEVRLTVDDEVHVRTEYGPEINEVRVLGRIPRSRCWHVGSRVVPMRGSRWYHAP